MCRCKINCLCSLEKINQINNNMKSETEFALTLTDLLTCENLDIVKTKLEDLLKKIKKENEEIISISRTAALFEEDIDRFNI
jgi:hypothetical protein